MTKTVILLSMLICTTAQSAEPLATLRSGRPRLLVSADGFAAARDAARRDPRARVYYNQMRSDSAKFLTQPPVSRGRGGMLGASRTALGRITFLAALYRMDGEKRFAERARDEMLAAARFGDWNPSHFLDTAEMTAAMAIGYDWLFDFLSPDDRNIIRNAIIEKGLRPGLNAYAREEWWTQVTHNWANVCAGGLALGALAIADDDPQLAGQIIDVTRRAMDKPLATLAPDGGIAEGPAYWNYALKYTVFYIAAAETALGNDLGLTQAAGLDQAGFFRIHTLGPTGKAFNFADSSDFPGNASQMFWLARRFNQPAFAVSEREFAAKWGDAFHLLWWNDAGTTLTDANVPLDAYFKAVDLVTFRSAWHDREAFYVAFKGGDNRANHAHLDLGSFILDALGERWATDLGSDDYSLPGYFGRQRWTYYRTRTEGHNTLLLDDANQNVRAKAPIIAFASTKDRAFAVADLSQAYDAQAARVHRGVELRNRSALIVQDELQAPQPVKVQWNFHTMAGVQLDEDGRSAELTQNGKTLKARILSPESARFDVIGCNPGKPQNENKRVSNLIVRLSEPVTSTRIVVILAAPDVASRSIDVPPLAEWTEYGKDQTSPK